MRNDFQRFKDAGAQIVVIAPHTAEKVKGYWEKENLPFVGIPDPEGILGKRYGQQWSLIRLGRMPALFVVDRKGDIAFAQYATNMADIPGNAYLINLLKELK